MFKPMLAPPNSPSDTATFFQDISWPQLASPKLDGIRALPREVEVVDFSDMLNPKVEGTTVSVLSRTLKVLPNLQIQDIFGRPLFKDFDSEIMVGCASDYDVYNRTQSIVMSINKESDDLHINVFDITRDEIANEPYYIRLQEAEDRVKVIVAQGITNVHLVPQVHCDCVEDLLACETMWLEEGFEGVMFRSPIGRYKHNRATYRENLIYKLKRFIDGEAVIIDFVEQMTNTNVKERDERGFAKRSSAKEGLVPAGTLGKFKAMFNGTLISIAPGCLTHKQRQYIWDHRDEFRGKIVKFRSFGHGVKDLPRHPRVIGFREKWDM